MEATYLLMLYVTLEQEIAIRQLYTSSGWLFRKTESRLHRGTVYDAKKASSSETESEGDVDDTVDDYDDDDDDENLPYEIDSGKSSAKETDTGNDVSYNHGNGEDDVKYINGEEHNDTSQDLLRDVVDSLSVFSNSFSDCETVLKEDTNQNGASSNRTEQDSSFEQSGDDRLNLEVDNLLKGLDGSDSETNEKLEEGIGVVSEQSNAIDDHLNNDSHDYIETIAEKQPCSPLKVVDSERENDKCFVPEATVNVDTVKESQEIKSEVDTKQCLNSDLEESTAEVVKDIKTTEAGCNTPVSSFQLDDDDNAATVMRKQWENSQFKVEKEYATKERNIESEYSVKDNDVSLIQKPEHKNVSNEFIHSVPTYYDDKMPKMCESKATFCDLPDSPIENTRINNEEKFKCVECNIEFSRKINYINHLQKHKMNAFDCPGCGKKFKTIRSLNAHRFNRSSQKVFTCDYCPFEATAACALRIHKKQNHPPEETFQCHLCAKIVKSRSYLNVHLKFCHNVYEESFECPICGHKLKRKALFAKHMEQHEKDHEFSERKCLECGKVFTTKLHLRSHMRVHKERSFLCDFCGKGFVTNTKLMAHKRTHTGDKPYHCTICSYKSTQKGNLTLHLKVHEKETEKLKKGEYVRGRKKFEQRIDAKDAIAAVADTAVKKNCDPSKADPEILVQSKMPDSARNSADETNIGVPSIEKTTEDESKVVPDYYKYLCTYGNAIGKISETDSNIAKAQFEDKLQKQKLIQHSTQMSIASGKFGVDTVSTCSENFTTKLAVSDSGGMSISESAFDELQTRNLSEEMVKTSTHSGSHNINNGMPMYNTDVNSNQPSAAEPAGSESGVGYINYAESSSGPLYNQPTTYEVESQRYGNQQDGVYVLRNISGPPNPNLLEQTASIYVDPARQTYLSSDSTVHYSSAADFEHMDQSLEYTPASSFMDMSLPSDMALGQMSFVNQSAADVNNINLADCQKVYPNTVKGGYSDQIVYQGEAKVEFTDRTPQHLYFATKYTTSVYPESPRQHLSFSDHDSQEFQDSEHEVYASLQGQHFPTLQQENMQ